jgi:hypothetical protein
VTTITIPWLLEKTDEAIEIANDAWAAQQLVAFVAAIKLAAELLQLARLMQSWEREECSTSG